MTPREALFKAQRDERDERILRYYLAHPDRTLDEIGDLFGLTGPWIGKVLSDQMKAAKAMRRMNRQEVTQ